MWVAVEAVTIGVTSPKSIFVVPLLLTETVAFTVNGAVPELGETAKMIEGGCLVIVTETALDILLTRDGFPTAFTYAV